MLLNAAFAFGKKDWNGKVVDSKGEPVPYANVAVLSKADSSVVCGAVTGEDGIYNIVTKESDGILMVMMLGYKTLYLTPADGAVITLSEDTEMLEGAVASAVMPKTKLTGEGLQTSVRGSVLENVGDANDVLAKTPGLVKSQNGIEVIGKGAPLVYINGHKVTDPSELERLQSNEIQSVEVIANPGAQYAATVKSVVRIRTIKRQGEGFGFNLNTSDAQSLRWAEGNNARGALNVNYRTGGVDIFGGVNYSHSTYRQDSYAETTTFGESFLLENKGDILGMGFTNHMHGNAGVNWQMADNHFIGGKVEWGRTLRHDDHTEIATDVFENGIQTDKLTTFTRDTIGVFNPYSIGSNIYYNGLIGDKLGVDVNLDYYGTAASNLSTSQEKSPMTHDRSITADSDNDARLYAVKAIFSYPLWIGQLQAGTEESFTRRSERYAIKGIEIPTSASKVIEDNYAGFASYGLMLPKVGMINAGIRYEYVRYRYDDEVSPQDSIARNYGRWFPTVSYAGAFGDVQLMLNYSTKTRRPDFDNLTSAIRYNNRYAWQSGNAQLQPELTHDFSLTAVWKYITLVADYTRTDDAIMTWSAPYGNEGVILVQPRNIDSPYRTLAVYLNLTPTIGIWTMNYTVGLQPQWLTITVPDPREASGKRETSFNGKPIFAAELLNTFTVKGGWQFEAGVYAISKGYTTNAYLNNMPVNITAAIQKTLLSDGSLILRLEGDDLAGLGGNDIKTDFGNNRIDQANYFDTQRIKLSLRSNFNTAKSKYRGTSAGADTRSRMK